MNDQLPIIIGLVAQLVDQWTVIRKVRVHVPFRSEFFQA